MKKLLVTMALVAACVSSFAQGKVLFGNDANHLIMLPSSIPAGSIWSSQAGLAIAQEGGANPNNISLLTAELWAGTSAANMSLQRTLTGNATGQAGFNDGRLSQNNTILTGVPAGVGFFQIRIWETSAGSWAAASQGAGLAGETPVFSSTTGSFAYNPLTAAGAPSNSTWANAPIIMAVPEPSSFALAGLGAAALLIFRRKK